MTSRAQMDVKGKGKPRGRRRPPAEAPAPEASPRPATSTDDEAAGPEPEDPSQPPEAEPLVLARQERENERVSSPNSPVDEGDGDSTAVLPTLPPDEPEDEPEDAGGGRQAESRRERRDRERAEEAEAIEAAALMAPRKPPRRERRAEKRAARTADDGAPVDAPVDAPAEVGAARPQPEPVGAPRVAAPRASAAHTASGGAGAAAADERRAGTPGPTDDQPRAPFAPSAPPPRKRHPAVPPGARSAARAKILRQRRRRRRTIIATTVLLTVVNLLVGSAYVYFQWRLDQISRLTVPGLTDDVPGEVMNVLLVGSDSRDRLTGDAAAQAGKDQVQGQRSDTIMVLHVDPRQQRAAILSIPRDLYIPIAGTSESDRVNTAFATGGPERLISTLVNLGIQVNHYAEVDFVGFREIVDAVGGVTVHLPHWARDFTSGLDVPRTGCVDLNGTQALAYVRSRNYESLIDGKWVADPRGDLGRIERQQDFVRKVMKKAVRTGISNPITLNRLIGIGVRNLTVDATMSTSDITNVARRFRSVDPDSVETLVLPTAPQRIDGKDVLVLRDQEARDEIAKINGLAPIEPPAGGSAPTTVPPPTTAPAGASKLSDVRVQVLNGDAPKGTAKGVGDALKTVGYQVVATGDAPPGDYPRTIVRYGTGDEAKARAIGDALEGGAELRADSTLRSADVALVLGSDFKGFKAGPGAAPSGGAAPAAPPTTRPPC